jgi:CBS domain-containing membrane protein
MSARTKTLGLDLDWERGTGDRAQVARIMLADATGFTRDGGAPTLTAACTTAPAFRREIERIVAELAELSTRGCAALESRAEAPSPPASGANVMVALPTKSVALRTDLHVRDVMTTDVKTLRRNDRISMAEELMKVGRFRHVVVLDEDDRVAGVISHRDIFYGALAWTIGQSRSAHDRVLQSRPAKDVMQANPLTIDPDVPLGDAARVLMERKIGCLPVVEGDRLVGILTEGDFLALLGAETTVGTSEED